MNKLTLPFLTLIPTLAIAEISAEDIYNGAQLSPLDYLYYDVFAGKNIRAKSYYPGKNTDPSVINAIKGTWVMQYVVGGKKNISTLVIDSIFTTPDGDITGSGLYYPAQDASTGKLIDAILLPPKSFAPTTQQF